MPRKNIKPVTSINNVNPFLQSRLNYYNGVTDHIISPGVNPETVSVSEPDASEIEKVNSEKAAQNPNGYMKVDGTWGSFNDLEDHHWWQPGDGYETPAGKKQLNTLQDQYWFQRMPNDKVDWWQQLTSDQIAKSQNFIDVTKPNWKYKSNIAGEGINSGVHDNLKLDVGYQIAQDPKNGVYFKQVLLTPRQLQDNNKQQKVLLSAYGPGKYSDTMWNNFYNSLYTNVAATPGQLAGQVGLLRKYYEKLRNSVLPDETVHNIEQNAPLNPSIANLASAQGETLQARESITNQKYQQPFNERAQKDQFSSDALAQGLAQGIVSSAQYLIPQFGAAAAEKGLIKIASSLGGILKGASAAAETAGEISKAKQVATTASNITGGYLKSLNSAKNLEHLNSANLFLAGFMMNGDEFYQQAKQVNLPEDKALGLTAIVGTANALIDMMGGNYIDNWGMLGKYDRKMMAKELVDFAKDNEADLSKASVQKALIGKYFDNFSEWVGKNKVNKVLGTAVEEGTQEMLQNYVDEGGKWFYNKFIAPDSAKVGNGKFKRDNQEDIFLSSLQQGLTGALSGAGMAIAHNTITGTKRALAPYLNYNKGIEQMFINDYIAQGQEEDLYSQNQSLLDKGVYSQDTFNTINNRLQDIVKLRDDNKDVFNYIYSNYKPEAQEEKIKDALNTLTNQKDFIESKNDNINTLHDLAHDAYDNHTLDSFIDTLNKAGRYQEANQLDTANRLSDKVVKEQSKQFKTKDSNDLQVNNALISQLKKDTFTTLMNKNYLVDENSKLNQELLNFKDYANIKTVVDSKQDDKIVEYNNRINELVQDSITNNTDNSKELNEVIDKKYTHWKSLLPKDLLDGEEYLGNVREQEVNNAQIQALSGYVDKLTTGTLPEEYNQYKESIKDEIIKQQKKAELDAKQEQEDLKLAEESTGKIVPTDPVVKDIEQSRDDAHTQLDKSIDEGSFQPESPEQVDELHSGIDQVHDNKLNEYQSTKDQTYEDKKADIERRRQLSLDEGRGLYDGKEFNNYFNEVNSQYDYELQRLNNEYNKQSLTTPINSIDDIVIEPLEDTSDKLSVDSLLDTSIYENKVRALYGSSKLPTTDYISRFFNSPDSDMSNFTGELKLSTNYADFKKDDAFYKSTTKKAGDLLDKYINSKIKFEDLSKEDKALLVRYAPLQITVGNSDHKFKLFLYSESTGTLNKTQLETRKEIISDLLDNGTLTLTADQFSRSNGRWNYNHDGGNHKLSDIASLELTKKDGVYLHKGHSPLILAHADYTGTVRYLAEDNGVESLKIASGAGSPGSIYMIVPSEMTINKKEGTFIKLNPAKYDIDTATKIARLYLYAVENKDNSVISDDVKKELDLKTEPNALYKDVLYYLLNSGDNTIVKKDDGREYLYNKQLFVEDGLVRYSKSNYIDPTRFDSESFNNFVDWLVNNKNYSINKLDLNEPVRTSFSISNIKFTKGDNYMTSLVDNGFILSDLNDDPKASLTRSADLIIDYKKQAPKTITNPTISSITETKVEPTVTATPIESKPIIITSGVNYVEGHSIMDLYNAKEGSIVLYQTTPTTKLKTLGTIHRDENNKPYVLVDGDTIYKHSDGKIIAESGNRLPIGGGKHLDNTAFYSRVLAYVNKINGIDPLNITTKDYDNPKYLSILDKLYLKEVSENPIVEKVVDTLPKIESTEKPIQLSKKATDILGNVMRDAIKKQGGATYEIDPKKLLQDYKKIDKPVELKRYRKMLSKSTGGNVEFVDKLVKVLGESGNARYAFAAMEQDGVTIFNRAETGTLYHEAFHRVSLLYLTPEERSIIYKDAKKVYNLSEYSDKQIEEYLADRFKEYIQDSKSTKLGKVKSFFNDIYQFIKNLFRLSKTPTTVNGLFKAIDNSEYKFRKINSEALANFKANYYTNSALLTVNDIILENIPNTSVLDKINNTLTYFLLQNNNVFSIEDFNGYLDYQPVLNQINSIRDQFTSITETKSHEGLSQEESDNLKLVAAKVANMYGEISDKFFTVFKPMIETKLASFNIVKSHEGQEDENTDVRDLKNDEVHSAYEYSAKESATADVRLLFASLRESDETDPTTFLPKFVDPNTAWFTLFNKLHIAHSYTEMHNTIKELAATQPTDVNMYSELLSRLDSGNEDFRTRFHSVFNKHRHNFTNVLVTTDGESNVKSIKFSKADVNRRSTSINRGWSTMFALNTFGKEDAKSRLTESMNLYDKIADLLRKNDTRLSYNKALDATLKLFNDNYIQLDKVTLETILSNYTGNSDIDNLRRFYLDVSYGFDYIFGKNNKSLFNQILTDKNYGKEPGFNFATVLGNLKGIRKLAEDTVSANPSSEDDSVLGADGALVYSYSEHNFITQSITEYFKDKEYLNLLNSSIYNRNSYWLKQLNDPKFKSDNLNIDTLLATFKENSGDTGRDYLNISTKEDALIKMGAIFSGRYILPTLANKRTYYFISGLNQFNTDIVRMNIKGKVGNTVNSDTVNYFKGVLIDEVNAIKATYDDIQKFLDDNKLKSISDFDKLSINDQKKYNYSNLVQNYHYGVKKESTKDGLFIGGKIQLSKANGIKFRYFASLNDNLAGKSKEEVLKYLDSLLENPLTDISIRNILNNKINTEISTLAKNGVINLNNLSFTDRYIGNDARIDNVLIPEEELNKYSKEWNNTEKIYNAITKYTINTMVSVIEFEKLLSGDLADYKNIDDRVKRYSALASTGTILRTDFPQGHELYNKNKYNSTIFNSNIINSTQVYSNLYNNYVDKYKELYNNFKSEEIEAFKDLTDEEIENKAITETKRILSGYKSTDQTDAQVYISPKFYRELLLRLGEWDNDKELAFNLLESDKPLTLEEEILAYNKLTMQPLKMVYYGPFGSGTSNHFIYDKMSLACIFGRVAKGRDIEHVYNMMKNQNIDMVKFDSAVKSGASQGTTFYNLYKDGINSLANVPVYKQEIKFLRRQLNTDPHEIHDGMLGTQAVKIGVHGINSDVTYKVGKDHIKGTELIENWVKSINQLTRFGKQDFNDRLQIDNNGNISKEALLNEIKNNAIRSGMPLNLIDNLKLKEDSDGTHYKVELSALPNMKWVESRLAALVKKNIVDINIPSGSFVQMSNFAFSNINKKNTIVKSEQEYNYENSGELNFRDPNNRLEAIVSINLFKHVIPEGYTFEQAKKYLLDNPDLLIMGYRIPTQGQNSIAAIHVVDLLPESTGDTIVLPAQFTTLTGSDFDIDKLYVARYNYKDVNGKLEKINFISEQGKTREQFLKELYDDTFGRFNPEDYQINKGLYSNLLLAAKDDISKTGSISDATIEALKTYSIKYSDFIKSDKLDSLLEDDNLNSTNHEDILRQLNKLFINKPSFESFFEKNKDKSEYELNNRKAIQNRLVDIYLSVLTNDDHTLETTTPLDATTEPVKNVVRDLDKLFEKMEIKDLTAATPTYQSAIKSQNTGADSGIGPMALSNTHTVLAQIAELRTFNNPILSKLNMTNLGVRYDRNGTLILDWTSALINAHVDAAKDPYILKLNVNQYTYNVTAFMIRSGVGVSTFYFLPQPILKEVANKFLELKSGKIGVDSDELKTRKYITDIVIDYSTKRDMLSTKDTILEHTEMESMLDKILDKNWLRQQLATKEEDRDANWYNNQLLILDYFNLFRQYGEALGQLVQASQIDTGKYGNNSASIARFLNKYYQAINNELLQNPKDIFDKTFLGDKLENSIKYMFDVFGKEFLEFSPEYINLINDTLNRIGKLAIADDKLFSTVARELKTTLATQFFNAYLKENNKSIKSLFHGDNSVVNRVIQLRNDILSTDKYNDLKDENGINNALLNLLQYANLKNNDNEPDIFEISTMKQRDTDSKNILTYAWRDLLSNPNDNVRSIANDLILYAYYTSGGTSSGLYNIFDYVPYEMFDQLTINKNSSNPISYSDYFRNIIKQYQTVQYSTDNTLQDNVFRSLSDNSNIVPVLDKNKVDQFLFQPDNKDKVSDALLLTTRQSKVLTNNDVTNPFNVIYTPYVTYDNTLYKFTGVLPTENGEQLLYHRANKLGFSKRGGLTIKEFGNESELPINTNYSGDITNIVSRYNSLLNGISLYDNNVVDSMEMDKLDNTEVVEEIINPLEQVKQDFLSQFEGDTIEIEGYTLTKEEFNNLTKEEQDNIINCHGK